MNSNYGKTNNSQRGGSVSLNNFQFDFGIGSTRSRPLNDQKQQSSSHSSSFSAPQAHPWQPNKPSWTHQPATTQTTSSGLSNGPSSSMVGDIFGKSWSNSSGPSSGIGIADKNPNLFGDLLGSALGKSNSNVPLKNSTPASAQATKSKFSMGNLADSLPKTGNSTTTGGKWGNSENSGGFSSGYNNASNANKSSNLGGPPMQSMAGGRGGGGMGMNSSKDPFGFLVDFGSNPTGSLNSASKGSKVNSKEQAFQNAPKSSASAFQSSTFPANNAMGSKVNSGDDFFGDFQNATKSSASAFSSSSFPTNNPNSMGSSSGFDPKMDNFGNTNQNFDSQNQPPVQTSSFDPLDMLFASSASAGTGPIGSASVGGQQFSEVDDWGLDSGFGGGHDEGGTTTELEGLPPPPAGVTAASAKSKGLDNYKQGQYADAIKWLSWAVVLLEKASDDAGTMEVLSCRASCYKEAGEYKKAVADCSKVVLSFYP